MSRYIDADALLNAINQNIAEAHNERCAQILEAVLYAPTADVAEVKHGEWLLGKYKCMDRSVCSVCNAVYEGGDAWNYCPRCGAKMDGEKRAEE